MSSRRARSQAAACRIATSETPDAALIEGIAAGDKAAMRILYARHSAKVFRFALRFAGDEAVAEDVVSETFFDVWRQAGAFEGRVAGGDLAPGHRP